MYASIRRYTGDAALADRLVEHEDEVRALISAVPGFRAYYLVRGADAAASVTVCDDQAGAEESNKVAANWLHENLSDVNISAPEITAGDVVIHGAAASART